MQYREKILAKAFKIAMADRFDGICLECGFVQHGVEPDAIGYTCENCGAEKVCGAEAILTEL